jgi:hypothetical protein
MNCRMGGYRERFTVGTEVKVVASRMHALVASAMDQFATLIAASAMDRMMRK